MLIDECVIVASNYVDYLRVTLPQTMPHVKRIVIVTSDRETDEPTRELCRQYGVKCISTGLIYARGASFAKGRALNKGLDQCNRRGWLLTMDADIILPPHTTQAIARLDLDPLAIYGIDRVLVPNAQSWRAFEARRVPQYLWSSMVETPSEFPLMARYVHETEGYCPIGFFQLRHGDAARNSRDLRYPEDGNEATHTDVQYALHWDRHRRHLIPEVIGYHLDSCAAPIGANWCGRVTPTFDLAATEVPPNAEIKSYYDPNFHVLRNPEVGPNKRTYSP